MISHKYLVHGIFVPIQKYFKFGGIIKYNLNSRVRLYSTTSLSDSHSIKFYEDPYSTKKLIIKDNKGKSGIYKWTNKLTKDIYIGQSVDLAKRFKSYLNINYLNNRKTLVISRALIKFGYSNFTLEVLEYCDTVNLTEREQYYFDKLNPKYNTLKLAGSSSGHQLSEETKEKISKSLKGVKEKSAQFGRSHTDESKALMSLQRSKENNYFFGKTHTEKTKTLLGQLALGRKHSEETLLKMSASKGHLVYIYEKCDSSGFKLIGGFVSMRSAAKFLGISGNTVRLYVNSGKIFKDRYKFSSLAPEF